jgi:hypothetical protein
MNSSMQIKSISTPANAMREVQYNNVDTTHNSLGEITRKYKKTQDAQMKWIKTPLISI